MQLVVDIPEDYYRAIKEIPVEHSTADMMIIRNGTPLPKGHKKIPVNLVPCKEEKGWIPVSERLPEDEQEIQFSTKTGRVHFGKYHDDDSANQWYSYRDKCRAWNNVVTAWMPLPEPYKAESEE